MTEAAAPIAEPVAAAAAPEANDEKLKEAEELFAQGTALLDKGDFSAASDAFSAVLEIKCKLLGELDQRCQEAYIAYGKSLLMQVKTSRGTRAVLASATAAPVASSSSSSSSLAHAHAHAPAPAPTAEAEATETETKVAAAAEKQPSEEKEKKRKKEESETDEGDEEDEDDSDEDEAADTEDILETAWGCLEVARVIAEKHDPDSVKLSDVLMTIGDVSLESDNMKQAMEDYTRALEIRRRLCKPDDRRIAETHFSMGLTLSQLPGAEQKSREQYEKAISVLNARIERLGQDTPGCAEIAELRGLVLEITGNIADLSTPDDKPLPQGMIRDMLMGTLPSDVAAASISASTAQPVAVKSFGVVGHTERPSEPAPAAAPSERSKPTEEAGQDTECPPASKMPRLA